MAPETTLLLTRPESGQTLSIDITPYVVSATGGASPVEAPQITLDFPADEAMLDRDGDDLLFTFDDGSSIVLVDFYEHFDADYSPSFEIEGTLIAGSDFFSAFDESLAPAAGPATQASFEASNFTNADNAELLDGVASLDSSDFATTTTSGVASVANNVTPATGGVDLPFDSVTAPVDTSLTITGSTVTKTVDNSNSLEASVNIDFGHMITKGDNDSLGQVAIWKGVEVSSQKVEFDSAGNITSYNPHGTLGFRDHDWNESEGLTVFTTKGSEGYIGNDNDHEIGTTPDSNVAEGVLFELPQTAHGLTITLDSFENSPGTDTSLKQWGVEEVTLSFYKKDADGNLVLVNTQTHASQAANGERIDTITANPFEGGYDAVLVAPKDNGHGDGSSFLINDIEFGEIPTTVPLAEYEGKVAFDFGTDASVGAGIAFDYQNGDTIGSNLGNIIIAIADAGSMTGTLDGTLIFEATLNQNGEWAFKAYEEFQVGEENNEDFELSFIVSDGNGDTVTYDAPIDSDNSETIVPPTEPIREHDIEMGDVITNQTTGKTGENSNTLGDDIMVGTYRGETLTGWGGDDTLYAGGGNDTLWGGNEELADGTIIGSNDILYGDEGDDILYGELGNDTLYGGRDNDILYGGGDNDELSGGAGDDTFAWLLSDMDGSTDTITDFTSGDSLAFMNNDGTEISFKDLELSAAVDGNNIVISNDAGEVVQTIVFENLEVDLGLLVDAINADAVA